MIRKFSLGIAVLFLLVGSAPAQGPGPVPGVTQLLNNDGTLIFTPSNGRGNLVGGINLSNPDTWTGQQTFSLQLNGLTGYQVNGVPFGGTTYTNTATTAVTQQYINDTSTGTAAGKIAKIGSTGVLTVGTSDTTDGIGICVAGVPGTSCSTSGNASIAYAGFALCFFDGTATKGDWVIISTTVAGDCSDGTATVPTSVEVIGSVAVGGTGAGLYSVDLNPVGIAAVVSAKRGGGGGGTCGTANIPCINAVQTWTASQRGALATITEAAGTATPNWSAGNNQIFTLVHADCPCTVANPTNIVAGQTGVLTIQQSATGSDTIVTWGGDFDFLAGTNPTLSTGANAQDYFSYYVASATKIVIVQVSSQTPALNVANIFTAVQSINLNSHAAPTPQTGTVFQQTQADATTARTELDAFGAIPFYTTTRADGTGVSPTAVQSGDQLGGYNAFGYSGSTYLGPTYSFRGYAAENFSTGHAGSKACIATTPIASTTLADVVCANNDGSVTINGNPLAIPQPQGRLTLVSGLPVMISDQTAKTAIFYDNYIGGGFPVYDGTRDRFVPITGGEMTLTLSASEEATANVFDVGAFYNAGTPVLCTPTDNGGASGKGWAGSSNSGGSNTARGTGGNAQLHQTRGYLTNVNAIADCFNNTTDYGSIGIDQWVYLGSYYTTAAGQTGVAFTPSAAAGGANTIVGLWNAYHRVPGRSVSRDNTASWTYGTNVYRPTDNSTSNRVSWVDGLGQTSISATNTVGASPTATAADARSGIDFDSTSAQPAILSQFQSPSTTSDFISMAPIPTPSPPLIGFHFAQGIEWAAAASVTFIGSAFQQVELTYDY